MEIFGKLFLTFSFITSCYISNRTSNCTTNDENATDYNCPFFMYTNKVDCFSGPFFGCIRYSRNMFCNSFVIYIFCHTTEF